MLSATSPSHLSTDLDVSHCHEASVVVSVREYVQVKRSHAKDDAVGIHDFLSIAGVTFSLDLYPNGDEDADEGFVSLYIFAESPVKIMLNASFECVDSEERERSSGTEVIGELTNEFGGELTGGHGWHNFCEIDWIADNLCDNTLLLRIKLKFVEKTRLDRPFAPNLSPKPVLHGLLEHVNQLTSELKRMLFEGHGDVTLVAAGGEISAHKEILKVRSPVFRAMFNSEMKEASSTRVSAGDIDVVAMRRFLHFIYTADLPPEALSDDCSIDCLSQLAIAGDKYDVASLVDACVHHLKLRATGNNILDILVVAQTLRHQDLKRFCLEYATKDKETLGLCQDSTSFETLSADLVRELFVHHAGSSKRKRSDDHEFPNGTDWQRLSYVQLQRACDERGLGAFGDKGELLAKLKSSGNATESEKA